MHSDCSAFGIEPAAHGVQLTAPAGATSPGGHPVVHSDEPADETSPPSHRMHSTRPSSWYPASHGTHAAEP